MGPGGEGQLGRKKNVGEAGGGWLLGGGGDKKAEDGGWD